ncbi:MAG: HPr family phosphocarrier protein [Christensenellales bacterium]|jgi:phosphotransferase system HPr (HPr) family protein
MKRKRITLKKGKALASENASRLVKRANAHSSMIWIEQGSHHVNAKSMMGVMALKLMGGSVFDLIASGADEEEALDDVVTFLEEEL